jgi:acetylornithine/N-succinyldiaminopimelate aminotransferase
MDHLLKCHPITGDNFVRGENCFLFDEQGRRFVDLEAGSWAAILGHAHPRINAVIKAQVDRVMHLGVRWPNHLAEAAAVDVLDLVGLPDGQCTFLSSGSEAVEFGVQAARRVTGRPLLLTFSNSYLAAFGSAGKKAATEWHLLDWSPALTADPAECLKTIPFDRIGGFVFEPGGGGPGFVRFPPAPLVQAIAQRIQHEGGLVVVNEITTGLGRTGKWFGYQHYDLRPDIVALGKGLGNGYPISATAIRREVADKLVAGGFYHAQSHQNNPLGCAVAREVIAILREGGWIERGATVGATFLAGLQRLQAKSERIKDARGRGMLLALEFHPRADFSGSSVHAALRERGFLAGCYPAGHPAGTGLRFDPSLTLEERELASLLECLESLLS